MLREELTELHFITPIANLESILLAGILSHNGMRQQRHASVAMQQIQDRRARKHVPGGRPLHDYVNLYVCARNPMMYLRRGQHESLCVLSLATTVLDVPGTVVTDQNASTDYVRFAAAPAGLAIVDRERTFARDWRHPENQVVEWRHKASKCAEVLVPDCVDAKFIQHVYVSGSVGAQCVQESTPAIRVVANRDLFFQQ